MDNKQASVDQINNNIRLMENLLGISKDLATTSDKDKKEKEKEQDPGQDTKEGEKDVKEVDPSSSSTSEGDVAELMNDSRLKQQVRNHFQRLCKQQGWTPWYHLVQKEASLSDLALDWNTTYAVTEFRLSGHRAMESVQIHRFVITEPLYQHDIEDAKLAAQLRFLQSAPMSKLVHHSRPALYCPPVVPKQSVLHVSLDDASSMQHARDHLRKVDHKQPILLFVHEQDAGLVQTTEEILILHPECIVVVQVQGKTPLTLRIKLLAECMATLCSFENRYAVDLAACRVTLARDFSELPDWTPGSFAADWLQTLYTYCPLLVPARHFDDILQAATGMVWNPLCSKEQEYNTYYTLLQMAQGFRTLPSTQRTTLDYDL